MPRQTNFDLLSERHQKMLELQSKIDPFTPTLEEIAETWQVSSTNTVRYTLSILERMGMVVCRKHGTKTNYYAV